MSSSSSIFEFIKEYYPEYIGDQEYPISKSVFFHKKTDDHWILSNMAAAPLVVNGIRFKNNEHLFQVMKFATEESVSAVYHSNSPKMTAKHYETVGMRRENWPSTIVDAMKYCLVKKYEWCPEFREALERTKGLYIVEDQTTFPRKTADSWGVKLSADGTQYVGPNLLGRLLMELRDNGGKLEYRLPEEMTRFVDLTQH